MVETWASTPEVRKRMVTMSAGRDTLPELALRRELWTRGRRYQVDYLLPLSGVRRRADIAFTRPRVAIFVDGCFWHCCPQHSRRPRSNVDYWESKLERNVRRDRHTDDLAAEAGWLVVRVWEHEDPVAAADIVEAAIESRR